MKWLTKLLKRKEEPVDIAQLKESILEELGEGKHIIHIMYKDRELTLSLTEQEFNNGIIRGEQLNIVPREEEIEEE